jgi:hypothetical protein
VSSLGNDGPHSFYVLGVPFSKRELQDVTKLGPFPNDLGTALWLPRCGKAEACTFNPLCLSQVSTASGKSCVSHDTLKELAPPGYEERTP